MATNEQDTEMIPVNIELSIVLDTCAGLLDRLLRHRDREVAEIHEHATESIEDAWYWVHWLLDEFGGWSIDGAFTFPDGLTIHRNDDFARSPGEDPVPSAADRTEDDAAKAFLEDNQTASLFLVADDDPARGE